jgi:hypothetical protein
LRSLSLECIHCIFSQNTHEHREIEFDSIENSIFGIPLPVKRFPKGPQAQIRLWEIVYLDDDLRILRARRPETDSEEAFIFITKRDEDARYA